MVRFGQVMKCRNTLVLLPVFLTSRPPVVCIRKLRMILHRIHLQRSSFPIGCPGFSKSARNLRALDLLQCTLKCAKVIQGSKRRRQAFLKQNLERHVAAVQVSQSLILSWIFSCCSSCYMFLS